MSTSDGAEVTRWARMTVERDPHLRAAPASAQVGYFAQLLPDTAIGRHAVQHIETALRPREYGIYLRPRQVALGARAQWLDRQERIAVDLRVILGSGEHSQFNAALRAGYRQRARTGPDGVQYFPPPNRLLPGSHDVAGFAAAVVDYDWIRQLVRDFAARPGHGVLGREPA
ncbi:hypothetical protein UG55_10306 [Frankia sp. EI5c]|nr:hypothetical protein UG55_10306 [Frankia sp. EI5c]